MATAPLGWRPADRPVADAVRILMEAWHRAQWRSVAARRAEFAHAVAVVDRWAAMRLLESGSLMPNAAGALRGILSGKGVTERVTQHGCGRGGSARVASSSPTIVSIGAGAALSGKRRAQLRLGWWRPARRCADVCPMASLSQASSNRSQLLWPCWRQPRRTSRTSQRPSLSILWRQDPRSGRTGLPFIQMSRC